MNTALDLLISQSSIFYEPKVESAAKPKLVIDGITSMRI
jgi:hypothetical protein